MFENLRDFLADKKSAVFTILFILAYISIVAYVFYTTITGNATVASSTWGKILYALVLIAPLCYLYYKYSLSVLYLESLNDYLVSGAYFIGFIALIYGIIFLLGNFSYAIGGMSIVIVFFIAVVGMALLQEVFTQLKINVVKGRESLNWLKFLWNVLFYIPCILIDFIHYISHELEITTRPLWSLFIIEIALLLLYHYFPDIVTKLTIHDGIQLVNEPEYLNEKENLGSIADIIPKIDPVPVSSVTMYSNTPDNLNDVVSAATAAAVLGGGPEYTRIYSVSFWVFINPQPTNVRTYSTPTNIFRIGKYNFEDADDRKKGKPQVTYFNNVDIKNETSIGTYRIYTTNQNTDYHDVVLTDQKWNLFTINYHEKVDVFVNGDLVITDENKFPPTFEETDAFVIGENGGLDGAICNLVFFPHILTQQEIWNYYNSLKWRNPPVVEINK